MMCFFQPELALLVGFQVVSSKERGSEGNLEPQLAFLVGLQVVSSKEGGKEGNFLTRFCKSGIETLKVTE